MQAINAKGFTIEDRLAVGFPPEIGESNNRHRQQFSKPITLAYRNLLAPKSDAMGAWAVRQIAVWEINVDSTFVPLPIPQSQCD